MWWFQWMRVSGCYACTLYYLWRKRQLGNSHLLQRHRKLIISVPHRPKHGCPSQEAPPLSLGSQVSWINKESYECGTLGLCLASEPGLTFSYSFLYSVHKYLLSYYYVPETVLDSGNTKINETKFLPSRNSWERQTQTITIQHRNCSTKEQYKVLWDFRWEKKGCFSNTF